MDRLKRVRHYFLALDFILVGGRNLLSSRWMWPYVLIPFLINCLLCVGGLMLASYLVPAFTQELLHRFVSPDLNFVRAVTSVLITILLWIGFLIIMGYSLLFFGSVLNSPFLSFMVEKDLRRSAILPASNQSFKEWFLLSFRMLRVSLIKLVVFAGMGAILFVMSFVPGLNLLSSFGAGLIVAFDCMDYSFEAMGWEFKDRLAYFRQNLAFFCGMATVLALTLLIPGLTLLIYPMAVIGAASKFALLKTGGRSTF